MKKILLPLLATSFAFGLSACSSSDDTDRSQVRVIHASPDAPAVNIHVNSASFASDLDYAEATPISAVNSGTYEIQVDGILPSSVTTVIGPVDLTFSKNMRYDIIAVDDVASIEPVVIETPTSFDQTLVRVTVAHLAPDVGLVDVYVTDPAATIAASTAIGTFDFKDSATVTVPADSYRIRITGAGSTTAVYDTGVTGIALAAGSDLLVGAFENTQITDSGATKAPVVLQVINDGDETALYNAGDGGSLAGDGADLRVVHASPDAPAVDILVNGSLVAALGDALPFGDFSSSYVNVAADSYNVDVVADADNNIVAIDVDGLAVANGGIYSVFAVGQLTDPPNDIRALVLADTPRSIATEAQVRIIHASTLAGNVDVYVTADGAGITGATPVLTNVPFEGDSGYLSLAAGSYDVAVTPTGTSTVAIAADLDNLAAGEIYTAVAVDGVNRTTPLGLILMDSFVP